MAEIYSGIRGTHDFNPQEASLFNTIIQRARSTLRLFGYEEIILPVLEEEGVFTRSLGDTTDIVEKQMFRIEGKDTPTVLRPEGTAQVVRYYVQNALDKQGDFYKFSYIGPMFRGERPQKGRYRQFHHVGVESFGSKGPYLDAEMIQMSMNILDAIGIKEKKLNINTLGCAADKAKYREILKRDLLERKDHLCDDCKRRLEKNPLRILDCKEEECKKIVLGINLNSEYLCSDCTWHFAQVIQSLEKTGIPYELNKMLVRGLDYYTNTVFEITSSALGSQDAIGAGGRYNNLVKALGGPDIPAIGFALGIERIILALNQAGTSEGISVFIAVMGDEAAKKGLALLQEMRQNRIVCDMDYCGKSLKAQLRYAQSKDARIVIIIGDNELKEGVLVLKDMKASVQETIKEDELMTKLNNIVGR